MLGIDSIMNHPEWRPIGWAPKNEDVLVWDHGRIYIAMTDDDGKEWWTNGAKECEPTHFMPLPPPPGTKKPISLP